VGLLIGKNCFMLYKRYRNCQGLSFELPTVLI